MVFKITRLSNLGFSFGGYAKKMIWDVSQSQQPITIWQFSGITVRECRNMLAVLIQNASVGMANSSDDAMMLLNIPFLMNHVIIDPLALNLIDICLYNTLKKDIM